MPRPVPSPERDQIFQQLAQVGQALSNPLRLRMLSMLTHKERTVEELARLTNQSIASASAHLKQLRTASLITTIKRGRYVHVSLANEAALKFWLTFRDFSAAQLPDAREIIRNLNSDSTTVAELPIAELIHESQAGRALLLDLRPRDEFEAGHLPGAICVPYAEFRHLNESLPETQEERDAALATISALSEKSWASKPVYAYCRGPFCLMAREGVALLRKLGVPVQRLLYSAPEWTAAS